MFDGLETLAAFSRHGTSARAAVALRITQAAVSKRIAALEKELGFPLLRRSGRLAVLTDAAAAFLRDTEPHLAAIREARTRACLTDRSPLRLALSESLALSWGGEWVAGFQSKHPEIRLDLHVHRAPLAVQQVAAGKYDLAVTPSWTGTPKNLQSFVIGREKIVLLASRLPFAPSDTYDVLTIEEASATWSGVDQQIQSACKRLGIRLVIAGRIESFAAVVQMARVGLRHGLAPAGIGASLGFPRERTIDIFDGRVAREITLVCRASVSRNPAVKTFREYLETEMKARQ